MSDKKPATTRKRAPKAETIVVAPGEVQQPEQAFSLARIEPPEMLAPVVKEYGLELVDSKVDSHLRTFLPFVSSLVELEKELTDLLTGEVTPELSEKAKALRGKYRDVRTGSSKTKAEEKREMVVEGRFLDKLDKTIGEAAELKEAQCLEIEKHLENLENARVEKLKTERRERLEALDYDTEFLNLADMTEENFNKIVAKAELAQQGAAALEKQRETERQLEAEKQCVEREHNERLQARINLVGNIGLLYDDDTRNFTGTFGKIDRDVLEFFNDAEFAKHFDPIKKKYDEEGIRKANEVKAANEAKERITNRINAVSALGLVYNASAERYEGFGQVVTMADINTMETVAFTDVFDLVKGNVNDAKQKATMADRKAKMELEDLQKKERQRKAKELEQQEAARLAELAPDKDKFKAFYGELLKLRAPSFTTAEGVAVGLNIGSHLTTLIKAVKGEANNLV